MIEWVDLSRHLVIRDQLWMSTNVYIEPLETLRLKFFGIPREPRTGYTQKTPHKPF